MSRQRRTVTLARKHLTFFRLHLAYFIIIAIVGTLILYGIGGRKTRMKHFAFIDCLYSITSALCITGLSSVPTESIPPGGQVVLMIMMILGGQVTTSLVPLIVKKRRYCDVARQVLEQDKAKKAQSLNERRSSGIRSDPYPAGGSSSDPQTNGGSGDDDSTPKGGGSSSPRKAGKNILRKLSSGLESRDDAWMREMASLKHAEHLREVFQEHRATICLTWIVVLFFIGVHLLCFFIAWGSILADTTSKKILEAKHVNAGFFALFATISAFANAGFILANENMTIFSSNQVLLLVLAALILLGNTMYAPAVRGIIWLLHRFDPDELRRTDYQFLLEHPRKCYTHLFPKTTTLWLVIAVTAFNGFECIMFFILDWKSKALQTYDTSDKVVNGIFQSVNTRSAGMNSMNLTDLAPSMLFLYCGMMYIAAYPVFLSRQYSRHHDSKEQRPSVIVGVDRDILDTTIATQSKRLLAQDWAYLFLSTFFICVSENKHLKSDALNFSIFSVIFEVISAYGNVGLSLGYSCSLQTSPGPCTDVPYSFSGKWDIVGKLLIILVMFLGRHRGLPDNIDSALLLPEDKFYSVLTSQRSIVLPDGSIVFHPPGRSECTDITDA